MTDKEKVGRSIGEIFGLKTKHPLDSAKTYSVLGGYAKKRKRSTGDFGGSSSASSRRDKQANLLDDDEGEDEGSYAQYNHPDGRSAPPSLSHSVAPYTFEFASEAGEEEEDEEERRREGETNDDDRHHEEEPIVPNYALGRRRRKPCFLCNHFSPKSDSAIIRKMHNAFQSEFWYRSFEHLAKMLKRMYDNLIFEPEMQIDCNARGLIDYDWEDFYEHIVSPDHMGLSFEVSRRKIMCSTAKDIERCEKFTTFVDEEGNTRIDCRVMDTKVRQCKLLVELYKLDAKDMADYSADGVSDSSKMGSFARHS